VPRNTIGVSKRKRPPNLSTEIELFVAHFSVF